MYSSSRANTLRPLSGNLDYFGGMAFKKYWGLQGKPLGLPGRGHDYIFVRLFFGVILSRRLQVSRQRPGVRWPSSAFGSVRRGSLIGLERCAYSLPKRRRTAALQNLADFWTSFVASFGGHTQSFASSFWPALPAEHHSHAAGEP